MTEITDLKQMTLEGIASNLAYKDKKLETVDRLVWENLRDAANAVNRVFDFIPTSSMDDRHFHISLMLTNVISDLASATYLASCGFHKPAAAILRTIIEDISVIVAIKEDETIFKDFQSGDLNRPKMVTRAAKSFSELGVLYGVLTNYFTHEPIEAIGRAFQPLDKGVALLLVPPVGRNGFVPHFTLISKVSMISHTAAEIAE